LIFVSGQVPAPAQGDIIRGSIQEQTKACIDNLAAILEAGGSGLDKVIKCNVYLSDMKHFQGFNEEYAKHFPSKPSRTAIAVAGLPLGVDIEIECTATS
jgi:2-iminobutanoate/2-iminopropanoate deaminase